MELKDKLSFGAKRVEYLMEEYFNRKKTIGYCKACPNYAKYWSCPPYQFNEEIFLKQFKYMHIIGRQYQIPREDIRNIRDPEGIEKYCTQKLDAIKVMTWKTLLEIENEVDGAIGLIPGNCPICEVQGMACARKINQPCRNSSLMRFSLESLGFNVIDLVKYEVGMSISWPENFRLPEVLTSVSGILCNEEIPKQLLKKYFPDKKKSWVKYNENQGNTGFHTAEVIKPEETVHGQKFDEVFRGNIIDEETPTYRPQKSWLGYKAEKDPKEPLAKKGWTVTIQGEEFEEEPLFEEPENSEIYEEEVDEKTPEIIVEEPPEVIEKEEEMILEEEDDSNYQWLGFKAPLEDEELKNRPIPKMSELILEGEEEAIEEKLILDDEGLSDEILVPEEEIATKEVEETEDQEIKNGKPEELEEEEDDSKYQWLGFKRNLDDEEEPLALKNTLSTLKLPK